MSKKPVKTIGLSRRAINSSEHLGFFSAMARKPYITIAKKARLKPRKKMVRH